MISFDQPVSEGVVACQCEALNSGTFMCRISGAKVNESPKGLAITEGRKLGARPRPSVTAPKLPESPTLASREKKGSFGKRPASPVSMRM